MLSPSIALKQLELRSNNGKLLLPINPFRIVAYPVTLSHDRQPFSNSTAEVRHDTLYDHKVVVLVYSP